MHPPRGPGWLAIAIASAAACSRAQPPAADRTDAAPAPAITSADAGPDAAPPRSASWTVATTLREPPAPLARGVTGIVAHVPPGFDARAPLHLVVFFHGSDMCALQLSMGGDVVCKPGTRPDVGAGLAWRHDDAGTQSVFVAPEIVLWGGGSPGRFAQAGYLRAFLSELVGETLAPGLGSPRSIDDVADVTLVAHSAGHLPVASILERGGLDDRVRNVVLLDALYDGDLGTYERWLDRAPPGSPRKLVSVHGTWGAQGARGRAIAERWARAHPGRVAIDPPGALDRAIREHDVTSKTWPLEHAWMLLLVFTKTIAGLDLPPRDIGWMRAPVAGTLQPAQDVAPGAEVRGTLDAGDTVLENGSLADDYTLVLAKAQRVTIAVRGESSFTEYARLDTFLEVLDAQGRDLARDDDGGGEFDPRLDFEAPEAAAYTIRISTHGSGRKRGPYVLRVGD